MAKSTNATKQSPKKVKKNYHYFVQLKEDELATEIESAKSEIMALKRGLIVGEVQNNKAYKAKRKELARALTHKNSNKEAK